MSDLRELYQGLIIDHSQHPRHFGALNQANRQAKGRNPLCGDQLTLYLNVQNHCIKEVKFQGTGCAIAMASASLMAERLINKTESEAIALFKQFREWIITDASDEQDQIAEVTLEKLMAFTGVRAFPTRIKCATLAWHTLQSALTQTESDGSIDPLQAEGLIVSTEDKTL